MTTESNQCKLLQFSLQLSEIEAKCLLCVLATQLKCIHICTVQTAVLGCNLKWDENLDSRW